MARTSSLVSLSDTCSFWQLRSLLTRTCSVLSTKNSCHEAGHVSTREQERRVSCINLTTYRNTNYWGHPNFQSHWHPQRRVLQPSFDLILKNAIMGTHTSNRTGTYSMYNDSAQVWPCSTPVAGRPQWVFYAKLPFLIAYQHQSVYFVYISSMTLVTSRHPYVITRGLVKIFAAG